MPQMNPIVQTLLQLIQAKQEDEQLAQRKIESENDAKYREAQLKQAADEFKTMSAFRKAQADMEVSKIREEIGSRRLAEFGKEGTRQVQGFETISQKLIPQFRMQAQAQGEIPYETADFSGPQSPGFQSFDPQVSESEFGSIFTRGGIPYKELRDRSREELWEKGQFDLLQKDLETRIAEANKLPGLRETIAGRENVANIQATSAEERARLTRESQERIAEGRNKALIAAARLRQTATNKDLTDEIADSAYLATIGKADLTGNSNNVLKQRSFIRQTGRVPFGTKERVNLDLDRTARSILIDADALSNQLSEFGGGVLFTGLKSITLGTDLRNNIKNLYGRAARVAEIYGERGRKSEGDIMRATATMLSAWITKGQAKTNIVKLQRDFDNNILNVSLRGMPEAQRIENLLLSDFDPELIKVLSGNKVVPKYFKDDDGSWKVYQNGKYVEVK